MKNLVVFAGLIFSHNFFDSHLIVRALLAFISFCMLSASAYLINDIKDIESDRQHPLKKFRPIASGKISVVSAGVIAVILAVCAVVLSYFLHPTFFIIALGYLLVMTGYSYFLKHVVIIDMMVIAGGFVLRAAAGAVVVDVKISSWLLVCTTFVALFLIIAKRRHEVILLGVNAKEHRKILEEYSAKFLDQLIAIVTAATLMSYMLYTVDAETVAKFGTHNLILTSPFVIFGVFRYLYLVYQRGKGGRPEQVLQDDIPLILTIILWVVTAMIIIY